MFLNSYGYDVSLFNDEINLSGNKIYCYYMNNSNCTLNYFAEIVESKISFLLSCTNILFERVASLKEIVRKKTKLKFRNFHAL